jgi:hypothetical protein
MVAAQPVRSVAAKSCLPLDAQRSIITSTADSLLTHSDRWTLWAMGYEGVCAIQKDHHTLLINEIAFTI